MENSSSYTFIYSYKLQIEGTKVQGGASPGFWKGIVFSKIPDFHGKCQIFFCVVDFHGQFKKFFPWGQSCA
jgi:hypothetical protein